MFIKLPTAFLGLLSLSLSATAQDSTITVKKVTAEEPVTFKRNIIKMNLSALAMRSLTIQFERAIDKKTTIAFNGHLMPYGSLPFKGKLGDAITESTVNFDESKVGNAGATVELRYYLSKKGAFSGFYCGPYISYNQYKVTMPVDYVSRFVEEDVTKVALMTGKINAFSWGVQMGAQFKLSKSLYLDWWIMGASVGKSDGGLTSPGEYSKADQASLGKQLEQLRSDLPFNMIQSTSVSETSANITTNGPWVGVRAFGINLGYRF